MRGTQMTLPGSVQLSVPFNYPFPGEDPFPGTSLFHYSARPTIKRTGAEPVLCYLSSHPDQGSSLKAWVTRL